MALSASARRSAAPREYLFHWEGKDRTGKIMRGEMRAQGATVVQATLRRQGVLGARVKKQRLSRGRRIREREIALFTRQLATMMRSGVPLLQAFDISIKGATNPSFARLLNDIRTDVETGSSLAQAFARHPRYFDALFCNLIAAGEQAGILDALLERLATYKEKILAIKSKIKSALFYPAAVVIVAALVIAVMMLFVIPEFKSVFENFGADLPAPTLVVIAVSDFFVKWWWALAAALVGTVALSATLYKRFLPIRNLLDRAVLRLPVIGVILRKAAVARWSRTLSTMFAAGVPLVEALESVGGAAGNYVYLSATGRIRTEVSAGTSLTVAMQNTGVFPTMVVQMVSIGEESGQLDSMLGKIADFYEQEVDDAVGGLSTLLEPLIMVFLGLVIGGLVVAMYLPIFKLGAVI